MIYYQSDNSKNPYNYNRRINTDYSFPPHFHRDFELAYVKQGSCVITVDGKSEEVKEGRFLLILQNSIHSYQTKEKSVVIVYVFSKDYVNEFCKTLNNRKSDTNCFFMDEAEKEVFFSHLENEVPDVLDITVAMNLACSAFLREKRSELNSFIGSIADNLMHKILNYISFHYTEDISLKRLAEELGYEEHYISRCFHKYFNKNFKQFINELRISKALEYMISNPEATIIEVAFSSGFQSVRNFNRVYKSIMGFPPKKTQNRPLSFI